MSDDEADIKFIKKLKTSHQNTPQNESITENKMEINNSTDPPSVSNVNVSNEYMELENSITQQKQDLLEEFERRKKARSINVPTDDAKVKEALRQLEQPICFFGEGPGNRRNRLRDLLSSQGEDAIPKTEENKNKNRESDKETGTWYHEGPDGLRNARLWIAKQSLLRAKLRLQKERETKNLLTTMKTAKFQELQKKLETFSIYSSQVGDDRPTSSCEFSPNSQLLATGSWSGRCRVWSIPNCELLQTLTGHCEKISAITFHPEATLNQDESACNMASCSFDGAVKLWNFKSNEPLVDIESHLPHRVAQIEFDPSGRFLGSCCYDSSWRLWDLHQSVEILHQEGHSKPVHCISFQADGAVCATGSLDAYGRVWDLRTGRCIMPLVGHAQGIYGIDFSPNGYEIATGGGDNTCKIWDLRKHSVIYSIPAHTSLITKVKFQRNESDYFVTASNDKTVKIWTNRTWQPLKTLPGHDGKVMSVDISPDNRFLVSSSYDRTFKLWTSEESCNY